MSAKSHNARIGLFVLGAIALFLAGLLAFGARDLLLPKHKAETAVIGDVYGLSVGARVELRGVPVGKVTMIGFDWNVYPGATNGYVIVEFEVDQKIMPDRPGTERAVLLKSEIRKGLRAVVKNQGVTGISILALEYLNPEQNPIPPIDFTPRNYYIPSAPSQFTRLLESIESSLREIQAINFTAVGEGVTNTLAGIHQLTDKLNEMDLRAIGTNVNELVVQLQGTVAEIRQTIKGMELDRTGRNAGELLSSLRDTNMKLQAVLDKAAASPIQSTVDDIHQAAQTLNDVLIELKRYPSGFIFGEPPPRAKSVEPPSK
jgi:ABC-type transporter Mla subunit MlaD